MKDLSAAWRYRCPHGHTSVRARIEANQNGEEPEAKYYCKSCADRRKGGRSDPHYDTLIDAKTGKKV
jgi:hypothetical protein